MITEKSTSVEQIQSVRQMVAATVRSSVAECWSALGRVWPEGWDYTSPLFCPGETASQVLFPVSGCPVQERKGVTVQRVQRIFYYICIWVGSKSVNIFNQSFCHLLFNTGGVFLLKKWRILNFSKFLIFKDYVLETQCE